MYVIHNVNMHKCKSASIYNNNLKVSIFIYKTLTVIVIATFSGVDTGWTGVDKTEKMKIGIGGY